jgi:CRISPR-associated protein Cmr1
MAGEGNETASKAWRLQAHTDIWTGDHAGKPDRLITTGLLGSIRWWCEVIVRGLGGSGCDPSNTQARCPDRQGRRCVVCELFGCTSWARKFRFDVLDANGRAQQQQITRGNTFQLVFTPCRPVCPEEWVLIDATIRLIVDYAAIGGKTVYKPSDEKGRKDAAHHRDYGIVSLEQPAVIAPLSRAQLQTYVRDQRWRRVEHDGFAWASLDNFWSVSGRYLARQDASRSTFNRVIGRPEAKRSSPQGDSWLAGRRASSGQQPESKKVFSCKDPRRTFGFTNRNQFSLGKIKSKLRSAWPDLTDTELKAGDAILEELLRARSA